MLVFLRGAKVQIEGEIYCVGVRAVHASPELPVPNSADFLQNEFRAIRNSIHP
jgi:hypothetical protein